MSEFFRSLFVVFFATFSTILLGLDCPSEVTPFSVEVPGAADAPAVKKWGFKWKDGGAVAIFPEYDDVRKFCEGLAAVRKGTKWGFVNLYGEIEIPFEFTDVGIFSDGMAAVRYEHRWGYITTKNAVICPAKFLKAAEFRLGLAAVHLVAEAGKIQAGYINSSCEFINGTPYDDALPHDKNGVGVVRKGQKFGLVDDKASLITEFAFDQFHESGFPKLIQARVDRKWGLLTTTTPVQWKANPVFDAMGMEQHGLARAMQNGLWGFLNQNIEWVITPRYFSASDFSDNPFFGVSAYVSEKYLVNAATGNSFTYSGGSTFCHQVTRYINTAGATVRTESEVNLPRDQCP